MRLFGESADDEALQAATVQADGQAVRLTGREPERDPLCRRFSSREEACCVPVPAPFSPDWLRRSG
jgi:hypothetical protein